jgi:hypothetical protein
VFVFRFCASGQPFCCIAGHNQNFRWAHQHMCWSTFEVNHPIVEVPSFDPDMYRYVL